MITTNAVVFYNYADNNKFLPKTLEYEFQINYSEAYESGNQIFFKNGPLRQFLRLDYRPVETYIGKTMKLFLKGVNKELVVKIEDIIRKNDDQLRPIVDVIVTVDRRFEHGRK